MKRIPLIVGILIMLMLLCSSAALADGTTFRLADASRLGVELPDGMVANVMTADGMIHVVIDDAATDWEKVLCSGGNYPYIMIRPTVEKPYDTIESNAAFTGDINLDPDYMMNFVERELSKDEGFTNKEHGHNHFQWSNGYFVAEIVTDRSLVVPREDGDSAMPFETWGGALICWVDYDDPDYRYYERVHICVSHKSMDTFNVPLRFISAATLEPTKDLALPKNVEIAGIENGKVTFDVLYVTEPDDDAPLISVAMKAPKGAASCWHARESDWVEELRMENGVAYIEDFYSDFAQNTRVDERMYTILWKDSEGSVIDYGFLWTYVIPADDKPWPCYVENWHAVDSSRVEIINGAANCGVDVTYTESNGTVHVGYNNIVSISGEPENVLINIIAPEGATCYRSNGSGSNVIIGKDDWKSEDQHYVVTQQDYVMLDETNKTCIRDSSPFREVQAGPVTVYIQQGEVWEYGGGVNLIYWYASEEDAINDPENPMRVEYVCDTNDVLCQEKRVSVISSEASITSPVTEITPVGDYPWTLVVRRRPQKGSNAFTWELHMENSTGSYQPLTGNMVFYVPYPKGHDNHTEYEYTLLHYDDDYENFSLVDTRRTEYGIRFEVSSLSPFVMSWSKTAINSVLTLPAGLKVIEAEAFAGMNMEQVVLPDGISSIGERAFADCSSLMTINLPATLETIADNAFSGCDSVTVIVTEGSKAHEWCIRNNISCDPK